MNTPPLNGFIVLKNSQNGVEKEFINIISVILLRVFERLR